MSSVKTAKMCINCARGVEIPVVRDFLCKRHGVVSYNFSCSKYKDLANSKSFKSMQMKCIHCEYFMLRNDNPDDSPNIGLCKLFSVRYFDGREKAACSKFKRQMVTSY